MTIWEHFNYSKNQFCKDRVDSTAEHLLLELTRQYPHKCTTTAHIDLFDLIRDDVYAKCIEFVENRNFGLDPNKYSLSITDGEIGEIILRVLIARLTKNN